MSVHSGHLNDGQRQVVIDKNDWYTARRLTERERERERERETCRQTEVNVYSELWLNESSGVVSWRRRVSFENYE